MQKLITFEGKFGGKCALELIQEKWYVGLQKIESRPRSKAM
jgi:hypothetical protein